MVRTIFVTGSNQGLGMHTVHQLGATPDVIVFMGLTNKDTPLYPAYASSKSALNMLTVQWSLDEEKKGSGIRVVLICPGFNATNLNNYAGTTAPSEGCKVIVKAALEKDGKTRVFIHKAGEYPWHTLHNLRKVPDRARAISSPSLLTHSSEPFPPRPFSRLSSRTRPLVSLSPSLLARSPHGCLSESLLVLPPPAPPVDNSPPPVDDSPPPEPETQKDSEPTDLFASVVVGPLPVLFHPPPRPPLPPPPPATASSSTKSKTAGSKKAEPHATYTTPRNLYLAVYALDVGASTAEFSERWKALEQEKPASALFQKKTSAPRPSLEDIRKHINTVMGTSAAV
ncbi:hypothetical protein B0H14DRAFT_2641196 [Mycena olivaceomarginata]|nr:hypothetical protein B0H14DRAFT_2641196 [Mycena olivaceomarginata]